MIQGFYFRFYRMTGCEWLSALFAHLAYFVFWCKFAIERMCYKKCIITEKKENALEIIAKVHPDPDGHPEYKNAEVDEKLDLSIIVPVYNYAELIENNILSILQQKTKYQYQLILVDDGSTDGSKDILRKYENYPNVKVIYQQNQGIAGARNTGLNYAAGRYIMFVDCDDTVEENLVEILLFKAYKDDCDIVMCAHNLVKECNGEIYEMIPNVYPRYNLLGYAGNAKILNYAGLPWCKVYKRELWENVRYLPGYWYEDTIIHSLLFTQCTKFSYDPVICYQYRWYEKNFSHIQGNTANPKCIDIFWLLKRILEQYEGMNLPKDERFETMLLKHLSKYYYTKISEMSDEVVSALFVLACDLYQRYGAKEDYKLPYMLRETRKALQKGDINLWKLTTKYQK